jgi:hypothetical protein
MIRNEIPIFIRNVKYDYIIYFFDVIIKSFIQFDGVIESYKSNTIFFFILSWKQVGKAP